MLFSSTSSTLYSTVGRRMAWDTPSSSPQGVFQLAFAPEVGQVRVRVGVGDADVDDAADAGVPGGVEHHLGLLHTLFMGAPLVVHPYPVGVEQGVGALQGFGQLVRLVEVEGA